MRFRAIETLEARQLLSAAVEVWAGNTDLRSSVNPTDTFLSIDQSGYTKIGESNSASANVAFSSATGYKYFVIATRGRVQIDSIKNSGGTYITQIDQWANASNTANAIGSTNSTYATVGTDVSNGTFAGFMLVVAPSTWTGLTLRTGTVQPMFRWNFGQEANFIQGTATAFDYEADSRIEDNGLITSARVHTPAGRWLTLTPSQWGDRGFDWESTFTSLAELNANIGQGTFQVAVQSPLGSATYNFSPASSNFPTVKPSTSSFTQGQVNAPTSLTVSWPAVTDTAVTSVSVQIEDESEQEIFQVNVPRTTTSAGPAALTAGKSYLGELSYEVSQQSKNANQYSFSFSKSNTLSKVFATAGFTNGTPDLYGNVSATPATLNPGATLMINIDVGVTGGMVAGSTPVRHEIGISQNQVWGDSDDVVLFRAIGSGHAANWSVQGAIGATIPSTAPAGTYYVYGRMDAGNAITESTEANNLGWSASAVITIPPQAITLNTSTHTLTVAGTAAADTIAVTLDAQTIHATLNGTTLSFAKADVTSINVNGNAGNDKITLTGALSGALIYGGTGDDSIIGGSGADKIYGNDGNDTIKTGDGADSVYAGLGADSISGGNHNDSLIGGDQSDTIAGDAGNDYIEGKGKADLLSGGAGNDTLYGGAGSNTVNGDDGDDRIYVLNSTSFRDTVNGGAGTDAAQRDTNDVLNSVEQNIL